MGSADLIWQLGGVWTEAPILLPSCSQHVISSSLSETSVLAPGILHSSEWEEEKQHIEGTPLPIPFRGMTWESCTSHLLTCCCPGLGHFAAPSCKEGCESLHLSSHPNIHISHPQNVLALLQLKIQDLWVLQGSLLQVQVRLFIVGDLYTKRKVTYLSPITHIPNMYLWRKNRIPN